MHILNIGDRLPQGDFIIHSRFSSVVNYTNGTCLLAWVRPEVGGGPNNIVADFLPNEAPDSFSLSDELLTTPKFVLDLSTIEKYDSTVQIPTINKTNLKTLLYELLPVFLETAPPKSLAFLIDTEKETEFRTPFEIELKSHIRSGVDAIQSGQELEGIRKIKGCGIGLTPSSDDFISGYLAALWVLKQSNPGTNYPNQEIIYREATGNNLISNTFMYHAKEGRFYEAFKKFLNCFFNNEKQLTFESLKKVQRMGATSGTDFLTGFLHTIKRYL
jgi:hypothetical protein